VEDLELAAQRVAVSISGSACDAALGGYGNPDRSVRWRRRARLPAPGGWRGAPGVRLVRNIITRSGERYELRAD